jgi:predicted nucleic acid-binding protein
VSESIKFAIDTNIVSAFFKGEPDIGARVREAQQVYLPIIVLAELYFGAEKSPDPENRLRESYRAARAVFSQSNFPENQGRY